MKKILIILLIISISLSQNILSDADCVNSTAQEFICILQNGSLTVDQIVDDIILLPNIREIRFIDGSTINGYLIQHHNQILSAISNSAIRTLEFQLHNVGIGLETLGQFNHDLSTFDPPALIKTTLHVSIDSTSPADVNQYIFDQLNFSHIPNRVDFTLIVPQGLLDNFTPETFVDFVQGVFNMETHPQDEIKIMTQGLQLAFVSDNTSLLYIGAGNLNASDFSKKQLYQLMAVFLSKRYLAYMRRDLVFAGSQEDIDIQLYIDPIDGIKKFVNVGDTTLIPGGILEIVYNEIFGGGFFTYCEDEIIGIGVDPDFELICSNPSNQSIYEDSCPNTAETNVNNFGCIPKDTLQKCYQYIGLLDDPAYGANPGSQEITSSCESGSIESVGTIDLQFDYFGWDISSWTNAEDIEDCSFQRQLYGSNKCDYGDPTCSTLIEENGYRPIFEWGQVLEKSDDPITTLAQLNQVYFDQKSGNMHFSIADITSDSLDFCKLNQQLTDNSNGESFVYTCYFAEQVYMFSVPQYVYAFEVTVTIDRQTEATQNLEVKKTLVQGQCCKNSLNIESTLHFCNSADGADCTTHLTTTARSEPFLAVWSLDLSDTVTNAIANSILLFPDQIKIGPFLPDWNGIKDDASRTTTSVPQGWLVHPTQPSSFVIELQSNVAFTSEVQFIGRVWESSEYGPTQKYPHICFIKDGQQNPTGCTQFTSTRRRNLQSTEYGSPETQMSISKALAFTEKDSQFTGEQKTKQKKETNENTVLIVVVTALAGVVLIAFVVGGIFYCKRQNNKKADQYKAEKLQNNDKLDQQV